MTIDEKLEHFEAYAIEEAKMQCAEQVLLYRNAMEQGYREHQEEKRRQEDLQVRTETDQIIRENNKALSREQIAIKRKLRQQEEELKEKLFVEVDNRLGQFLGTRAYGKLLEKQLKEALAFAAGEEVILYIDPADSNRKMELESRLQVPVTVSQYSFHGGMRAVIPSRNILIDNSFETKLAEAKEAFVFEGGNARG